MLTGFPNPSVSLLPCLASFRPLLLLMPAWNTGLWPFSKCLRGFYRGQAPVAGPPFASHYIASSLMHPLELASVHGWLKWKEWPCILYCIFCRVFLRDKQGWRYLFFLPLPFSQLEKACISLGKPELAECHSASIPLCSSLPCLWQDQCCAFLTRSAKALTVTANASRDRGRRDVTFIALAEIWLA